MRGCALFLWGWMVLFLYAARHGQTDMNARNEISGVTDLDLNETGIVQAELLAEKLVLLPCPPRLIIASDMQRAKHTAAIAADRLQIPLLYDKRLREQNYGSFEGMDRFTDGFLQTKSQFAVRYPGGESMLMTGQRVYNFLDDVLQTYRGVDLLVVAHGGILRILRTYFMDMTNSEFFHYNADNAGFETYTIDIVSEGSL